MSKLRTIVAALLFLAWLPAVNACAIASLFPGTMTDCCEQEEHSVPCEPNGASDSCATCIALENGFSLNQLQPLVLIPPVWIEEGGLQDLVRTLAQPVDVEPIVLHTHSPPLGEFWQLVGYTTAPARGPSFGA